GWRNPAPPPRPDEFHSGLLPEPRLKVVVASDGLYKITRADLAGAGLDPDAVDPRRLGLYGSSGKMLDFTDTLDSDPLYPVPVYVAGEEDGTFDEGDALYFWGRGNIAWRPQDTWDIAPADAELPGEKNLNSVYGYYWLAETKSPSRFITKEAAPTGEPLLAHLQGRAHVEQDDIDMARSPFPVRGMDFYFFKSVNSISPTTLSYQLDDYAPRGNDALLALRFKPSILAEGAAVLRVYVGSVPGSPGEAVITVAANQLAKLYEAWGVIPDALLKSGTNSLTFELDTPFSTETSSVNLDVFQVIYSRGPRMQSGLLEGWGPPGVSGRRRLQATDFTGEELFIWDLTRGESLVNYETSGPEGSRTVIFAWDAEPDYHLVVADKSAAKSVLDCYLDTPSDLHAPVAADVIYIAHPDLLPALDPLVQMHRANGLRVMTVRVDDIYDEYSGGRLDPAAIRNFLYHAYSDCVGEPLTFVTLVGDTTYDLRDPKGRYDGPRWKRFPQALLPTAYVRDTTLKNPLVASDCYFASLLPEEQTSEDVPVPQVALTRISADSAAEVEAVVGKLTRYPLYPPGSWQLRHVMLVDNTVIYQGDPPPGSEHEPINFDIYAERMLASSSPGGMNSEKLYLTALGMGRTGDSEYTPQKYDRGKRQWATREHVTPAFSNALAEPALVLSFIGHGAWHTWTHELAQTNRPPLYRDFADWGCPVPPLLIQSSCSVSDFDRTPMLDSDCVSELLLVHPQGVIAVTGSTRLASGDAQDAYHRALFEAFYHPDWRLELPAFGLAHMQNLLASGNPSNRQRQMMFGDSASLFRRAEPGLILDPPQRDRVARGEVLEVAGALGPFWPGSPAPGGTAVEIRAYDRPVMPYTYNETRIYRQVGAASCVLEGGRFSTGLALPLDMYDDLSDHEIYPYTLELHAFLASEKDPTLISAGFSGSEAWRLPIIGSVEPPADNEGPSVNLIFDDGRVASGDYISGRVKLTAELEDPHGILLLRSDGGVPMASGDIDRPIVLFAQAGSHSFDIDLTDDYAPLPGDYTRG
ncbi:MAG TPA: hypothetical protein ENN88_03270, partial [Candidatus Coatesbacteria bacterium]|nr:hypothetical protein [Candidatus Coatesbacteria bacterium]